MLKVTIFKMLNFTVRKLALQKSLDMMPFSNLRMNSFTMDKSRFSYFANSFQFKSLSTKVSDTLFSYSLHSAIKIDGNLLNNATSSNTQQIYQQFTAFNCYFLHCKNNISGGAFTSNGRDAIVHFERCFFEKCVSEKEAGAIYIKDGSLHLTDSTFKDCLAYASAQAIYVSSYPRNSIRLQRTSIDRCPVIAPDLQGSVVHCINGEQTMVETNVTHSKIVSGSGSIKSVKPYNFDGRYCCISFNHGTSTMAIFHNSTIEGPVILDYYNIVNNTLEGDDLIQTNSIIYLRNSVIADNKVVVEVISYTPAPTKKLSKLSMVSSKKKKEEKTAAPTPTKSIFIRLELSLIHI